MKTKNVCHELSKILKNDKEEIVQTWEKRVKEIIGSASKHSNLVLIDHLPELISNLSEILENKSQGNSYSKELEKKNELTKAHGRQRATQLNYSLREVLIEYNVLRGIIVEKIYSKDEGTLSEALIVHSYLDEGVQSAVLEFVKVQNNQIENTLLDLKQEKDLRETFVSALTHDLRTPITAAKISAQMIRKNPVNIDNVHKQISRIIKNVDRIDYMIQDLLDTNLIKAGRSLPIFTEEINLKAIVEETLSDLIVSYGPRFILNIPTDLKCICSRDAIRRIIENLCSNAVKYGAQDRPIIVEMLDDDKNIFINIKNQGKIIPENEIEQLYGQYQRSKEAIMSGHKGWGIGLTLVKGLVEAHGGSIGVVSNKQVGTVFKIQIPKI